MARAEKAAAMPVRLAFYSDQIVSANREVDAALARHLPPGSRIAYIPSAREPDRKWFGHRRRYYEASGWDLAVFHEPEDAGADGLAGLLACDAVHLSGGDTSAFQRRLERAGLMPTLRGYARSGGVLIGTSAGAIMLTPSIALDAIYRDVDPADERDIRGLGLVDFEFYPHAEIGSTDFQKAVAYSCLCGRTVFACPDGSGIIVDGQSIHFIGPGWRIDRGCAVDWRTL